MNPLRLVQAIVFTVTLRCERLDRLRTNKDRADWSRGERFAERLHTSMCKSCRRTRRKLERLNEGLRSLGEVGAEGMPESAKERVRRGLRESS